MVDTKYEVITLNANTVVDALRLAGVPLNTPATLVNPGGANPWLFSFPAGGILTSPAVPVVAEVPNSAAQSFSATGTSGSGGSSQSFAVFPPPIENWVADGKGFIVRAAGKIQPNSFGKTIKFYWFVGNGLLSTAPGYEPDVQIALVSQVLPASVSAYTNYQMKAECIWDSQSLQLTGVVTGQVAGTAFSSVSFVVNNISANVPIPFVLGANLASSANANPDLVLLTDWTVDMN